MLHLYGNLLNDCHLDVSPATVLILILTSISVRTSTNWNKSSEGRGARYVRNNYWDRTPGCVTRMVRDLRWQTLEERRCKLRLLMLFKIQHGLVDMVPGNILQPSNRVTQRWSSSVPTSSPSECLQILLLPSHHQRVERPANQYH